MNQNSLPSTPQYHPNDRAATHDTAALVKDYGSNTWQLLHILRDNLGSITHIVDTTGIVVQELSYTPWGALRNPETLQPYLPRRSFCIDNWSQFYTNSWSCDFDRNSYG